MADAITDNKGTAGPRDSFQQLSQAIRDLAQIQYNDGHGSGLKTGYDQGYDAGIAFADGRVNENSASYLQGASAANPKIWETEIKIKNTGPDKEGECIVENRGSTTVTYSFHKEFGENTVMAAYIETEHNSAFTYRSAKGMFVRTGSHTFISLLNNNEYEMSVTEHSVSWGSVTIELSNNNPVQTLRLKVLYA